MTVGTTKIDLGREYAAGVNMPAGSGDSLKLARANTAGTNLEYVAATTAVTADGTLAAALAPHLAGDQLEVVSDELAFRRSENRVEMFDDFLHVSTNGSNVLGDTPWILAGVGTPTVSQSDQGGGNLVNRAGLIELNTSASANDTCVLHKSITATTETIDLDSVQVFSFQCFTIPADCRITVGLGNNITTQELGTNSYRFDITASAARCIRRASSVDTDTVTVGSPANPHRFGFILTPGTTTVSVYYGGSFVGSFDEISGQGCQVIIRVETTVAAAKTVVLDYVRMTSEVFDRSPFE